MDVLPAIDLREGNVVRLRQGDYGRQTTYSSDPAGVASELASKGAEWIHVVDLDAAKSGQPANAECLKSIRRAVDAKVQLGGGARDERSIEMMLTELADRVVVGSAAVKNWPWFEDLINRRSDLAGRIALGLDARRGLLAVDGWTESTTTTAGELAARVSGWPLGAIVYTDIARDGMLRGPNVQAIAELIRLTDVPVIASGGVHWLDDVVECRRVGCAGVIIGRAYYEGTIDLAQAIAQAAGN